MREKTNDPKNKKSGHRGYNTTAIKQIRLYKISI